MLFIEGGFTKASIYVTDVETLGFSPSITVPIIVKKSMARHWTEAIITTIFRNGAFLARVIYYRYKMR